MANLKDTIVFGKLNVTDQVIADKLIKLGGTDGQVLMADGSVKTIDDYVIGPGESTDNAIARYDGETGKVIKNSGVTIDANNNISTAGSLKLTNNGDILWNSGSWWQRIKITDDSTENTNVFEFQQSSNSGTNYTTLFAIKDNKTIVQGSPSTDSSILNMNRFEADLFVSGNGTAPNSPKVAGFYLGKSAGTDENRHMDIVTGSTVSYIDFNRASSVKDYDVRLRVDNSSGLTRFQWASGSSAPILRAEDGKMEATIFNSTTSNIQIGTIAAPTTVSGDCNIAVGPEAVAVAGNSIAIGYSSETAGANAVAIGTSASSNTTGIAIGDSAAANTSGLAIGALTLASIRSIAIGESAETTGEQNVVVGLGSTAGNSGGGNSVVIGSSSEAGVNSVTIGTQCSAGNGSITIGYQAAPDTEDAIAIGYNASPGGRAIALGHGAITNTYGIAIGYNVESVSNNIVIGSSSYNATYYGGSGTTWTNASDIRDKTNINPIHNAINILNEIEPITFNYNNRKDYSKTRSLKDYDKQAHKDASLQDTITRLGFSAQSVGTAMKKYYGDELFGDIIQHHYEDTEDWYTITIGELIPIIVSAIQEQQKVIENLKSEIAALKGE